MVVGNDEVAEQPFGSGGDTAPDGVQRLLYNYRWDADLVGDDLRDYVVDIWAVPTE